MKSFGMMFYEHDSGDGGNGGDGNSINVLQIWFFFSVFCFVQCILVSIMWRSLILRLYISTTFLLKVVIENCSLYANIK